MKKKQDGERLSERITDGDMKAEAVPETAHIVIAAAACVVRRMDADTDVESENEEVKVVALHRKLGWGWPNVV